MSHHLASELHDFLRTVITAPMTTGSRPAPYRPPVTVGGKNGRVLVDQIRTLDKSRLVKRLGKVTPKTLASTLQSLRDVFAE